MSEVQRKSWFARNWGWVLGGGCLTIIIIGILLVVGVVATVSNSITGSEPYTYAYQKATESNLVIEYIGEPIETNGMGSTDYSFNNGVSKANLNIPIKGPVGEGVIVVDAEKIDDEWVYKQLYFLGDTETEIINLLDAVESDLDNF